MATQKRKTTDELILEQQERLKILKARKRREVARKREREKQNARKHRTRCLIVIGASMTAYLKSLTTELKTSFLKEMVQFFGHDPRSKEAIEWLCNELNIPVPPAPAAAPVSAPAQPPAPAPAQAQDKPAAPAPVSQAAPVSQ